MSDLSNLIKNLKGSGILIDSKIEKAMYKIDIEDFTEYDYTGFFYDRPVVFLETPAGGQKNISAPHMIVTMLNNLELEEGQKIVVLGAKGGYICALIAHIVGEKGRVTVLDPSDEVIEHISNNLRGYPTVECIKIKQNDYPELLDLSRVLVTGQIQELPEWVANSIQEGGFAIAPIGDKYSQRLLKLEKQNQELYETDLGSVVFGPLDINESILSYPSPTEMSEMIEHVIELMTDNGIISNDDKSILYDLVAELRQLPDDLPPPDEMDSPEEHPMMKLMLEKGEWFIQMWPIIQSISEKTILSFDSDSEHNVGNRHSDFIP